MTRMSKIPQNLHRDLTATKKRVSYRDMPVRIARLEVRAVEVRQKLLLDDSERLPHDRALALLPDLFVHEFSRLPVEQCHIEHMRNEGRQEWSGLAYTKPDGSHYIVINDAHHEHDIRVTLMEEFFHLYLKHPTETVRRYHANGDHRSYNAAKEREAYGCAFASLVPYHGLAGLLSQGVHHARIAEHFDVSVPVVHERISMTSLGGLSNSTIRQHHLFGPSLPTIAQRP